MFRTPIGTSTSVFRITLSPPKVEIADAFVLELDDNQKGTLSQIGGVLNAWFFPPLIMGLHRDVLYSTLHPANHLYIRTYPQAHDFWMRWYDQVAALVVLEPLLCDLIRWRVCGFL